MMGACTGDDSGLANIAFPIALSCCFKIHTGWIFLGTTSVQCWLTGYNSILPACDKWMLTSGACIHPLVQNNQVYP